MAITEQKLKQMIYDEVRNYFNNEGIHILKDMMMNVVADVRLNQPQPQYNQQPVMYENSGYGYQNTQYNMSNQYQPRYQPQATHQYQPQPQQQVRRVVDPKNPLSIILNNMELSAADRNNMHTRDVDG